VKKILFVCSGNSCRSQMAEGWGKELADNRFEVNSAGISPIGVHPSAIASMHEVGIDISGQTSKMLDSALINWADYVITLCNSARDNCPVIPGYIRQLHWAIDNPDQVYLSEDDRRKEFARVRDEIKERIEQFYADID